MRCRRRRGSILLTPAASLAATTKKAPEQWVVVKIGDDYKAIRSTEVSNEKKKLADDYNKREEDWKDEKRNPTPRPQGRCSVKFKIVKSGFTTEEGREEYIDKVVEEGDQKDDSKGGSKDKGRGPARWLPRIGARRHG